MYGFHWRFQGGCLGRSPRVQILLFSCSFRQKKLQNNRLAHHFGRWRPPQENPGSATGFHVKFVSCATAKIWDEILMNPVCNTQYLEVNRLYIYPKNNECYNMIVLIVRDEWKKHYVFNLHPVSPSIYQWPKTSWGLRKWIPFFANRR